MEEDIFVLDIFRRRLPNRMHILANGLTDHDEEPDPGLTFPPLNLRISPFKPWNKEETWVVPGTEGANRDPINR